MTRTGWMISLAAAAATLATLAGCAAQQFPGTTAGRSRTEQILLATSVDDAVNQMTQQGLDPLTGKKVYVRVGDLDAEDFTTDYIRATIEHRLASLGVVPVETDDEADALMIVRARVAGTDRSDPIGGPGGLLSPFRLLFDYNKMWCAAELDCQAVDRKNATILLASRPTGSARNTCTEWSILPILFAPPFQMSFKSSTVDSPLLH